VQRSELSAIVCELVEQDTINPPGNEHRVRKLVTERMRSLGMKVAAHQKEPGRTNLVGRIGKGRRSIAFITHMDTVAPGPRELWKSDPLAPQVKNGRIYGLGALDNKGCFASTWGACKAFLAEYPDFAGTLYLVAAADEEMGSKLGVLYLLEECGLRFDVAVVPDGGNMNVAIYGEKGIYWLEVESMGQQAHGSLPELGKNAIDPIVEFLTRLRTLDLGSDYDGRFDGWSMNVGTIEGGSSANSVPSSCKVTLDFRLPKGIGKSRVATEIKSLLCQVKEAYPWARFRTRVVHASEPHLSAPDSAIFKAFDRAAEKVGIPMSYATFGGNTVAKDLHHAGIPALVHYPGDDRQAHVPNESVKVADLERGAILYAETLDAYFGSFGG
jgi:acetylornithine deacetylase/succinyl-diaminopimelate desuccinylase-like protein